ncbi:phosphatase PAP2 family protein [Myroides odoratimimus]|uniref:phosphatase PAP2 family protein n=1 Tax=Myroides odoratimimus TaxID=76832 RepID=UPI002DBCFCA0|nr:phosphatase PAP2 family protein [Myroides odoratimimus]MEC4042054.1 phosphatase PAP2 family protein [Myroides odoratimimus]MEC4150005.1 phosphatase PAP2 family protein [Myroides odoratimimus]
MAKEEITPTFKQRTKAMLLCYAVFIILYMAAQYYAVYRALDWSVTLAIDPYIPFIEWMIIPYSTSGLFFLLVFYWVDSIYQLRLLTKRMLAVTIIAFIGFIVFPIQFTVERPLHTVALFNPLFDFITTWDTHYNQAPSLHVAYAIVFMTVVEHTRRFKAFTKVFLHIWLALVALSTLFVYQHHTIDLITAILVCLGTFIFLPNKEKALYLNIKKGLIYFVLATMLLGIVCYSLERYTSILLLWIATNLIYIGIAYIQNNIYFIKDKQGQINLWKYLVLLPYITTYYILRRLNKVYYPLEVKEMIPQLYIGSLLSSKEASAHFDSSEVITYDLSAEMKENSYLLHHSAYHFYPLLDVGQANQEYIQHIVTHIINAYQNKKNNTVIYIHCAMGLSRSMTIAALVYAYYTGCTQKDAQAYIQSINQNAIFKL